MPAMMTTAPTCFAHPALLGTRGAPGVQYLAVGQPDITETFPKDSGEPDWARLATLGAPAALEITPDEYVEVRAFRGAYFSEFSRHSGLTTSWSSGSFLFPAHKPYILGAYKCFREFSWDGDIPMFRHNALSVAGVGHKGQAVVWNSERGIGPLKKPYIAPFISAIMMMGAYDSEDALIRSLGGISDRMTIGARQLFHRIFGTGSEPSFGTEIYFYIPESATGGYDVAVPLVRPNDVPERVSLIGYSIQRSRFVDLHGTG